MDKCKERGRRIQTPQLEHKRKILFVSHEASLTGAPIFLRNLLHSIKSSNANYNIMLHCANNGPLVQALQKDGFHVVTFIKRSASSSMFMRALHQLAYYLRYMALLNQFKPDLIYSNTMYNFSQVIIGRLMGAKTIVHMHEGKAFASKPKLRFKFSGIFTTKYIVGSKYVAEVLKGIVGVDGEVVYNGIKTTTFTQDKVKKQNIFSLFVIGTVDRNKAQLIAIKAVGYLARVKNLNVQLKIVGRVTDAEYGEELQAYVNKKGLRSVVTFIGPVDTIEDSYQNLDALIVPSLDEAFPTVILEAMAFQKPVIASNTGGIPEIVKDGVTGLLFKTSDFMDLANKIESLLDDDFKERLVANAYLNIKANFSLDETKQKIVQIIDCVLNKTCAKLTN